MANRTTKTNAPPDLFENHFYMCMWCGQINAFSKDQDQSKEPPSPPSKFHGSTRVGPSQEYLRDVRALQEKKWQRLQLAHKMRTLEWTKRPANCQKLKFEPYVEPKANGGSESEVGMQMKKARIEVHAVATDDAAGSSAGGGATDAIDGYMTVQEARAKGFFVGGGTDDMTVQAVRAMGYYVAKKKPLHPSTE